MTGRQHDFGLSLFGVICVCIGAGTNRMRKSQGISRLFKGQTKALGNRYSLVWWYSSKLVVNE